MSSGGSSISFVKSNTTVEGVRKGEPLTDKKLKNSEDKKSFVTPEVKVESLNNSNLKHLDSASSDQLHHYARNFIMVQR